MKPSLRVRVSLATLLIVSAAAALAPAQELARETRDRLLRDVAVDSIGARAADLVLSIRADVRALERYHEKLARASSEDSLVLRAQIFQLQTESMRKLHALADDVARIEKDGPRPVLHEEVVQTFERVTPRVWAYLGALRTQIDQRRALRAGTAPAARPALEDRVARLSDRLDTTLEIAHEHLARRASLGIATAADSAAFTAILDDRADELSGRVSLSLDRIADLSALLKDAPDNADTRALLVAERKSLKTDTASMGKLLAIRGAMKLPSEAYRAQLVVATRDLTTGLSAQVAKQLVSGTLNRARVWLRSSGPGVLVKILLFVGILLLFHLLARFVRAGVGKALDRRPEASVLLRRMAVQAAGWLVLVLGFIVALGQLGISVGPMVAGLGVAGFIVGFALQDTLANFAAGMMILLYRPYDVGDVVDVTGAQGKVERMTLVSTNITTFDNQTIVVPNSRIWGDVIKNVTHQMLRRVDMEFGISYADDIPKAERLLADIVREHPRVLADPAPVIKLHKLNESSVDFVVRPWVAREDYWDVYWDITREVKMRFDREGISIPFPQRDVHVHQAG